MTRPHPDEDRLIDFALGDLDVPGRGEIETHLAACEECAAVIRTLAAALEGVRATEARAAPSGVLVRLLEAQAEGTPRRSPFRARLGLAPAFAGAAAVAVLFLGGFWAGRSSAPVPSEDPAHAIPVRGTSAAERDSLIPVRSGLPEPPAIPFQSAT